MNTTVYAAMLMAFLNAGQAAPKDKDVQELTRGPQGSLKWLVEDRRGRSGERTWVGGLRGEFRQGGTVWLASGKGGACEVGVGFRRSF